jgi:alpha-glucosidase
VNPNYRQLNSEDQKAAAKSHYKVYKQLIDLRKTPTIQRGGCQVAALSVEVLAFIRYVFPKRTYFENTSDFIVCCSLSEIKETLMDFACVLGWGRKRIRIEF